MIEQIRWHDNPLNVCKSPRFVYGDSVMLKVPLIRLDCRLVVHGRQYTRDRWNYLLICPITGFGGWFTEKEISKYRLRDSLS